MKERVLKILNDLRPEFDFSQAVNFVEEGMLDSFDVINLVTTLDEEFGISSTARMCCRRIFLL